jgi:hypothetical protein
MLSKLSRAMKRPEWEEFWRIMRKLGEAQRDPDWLAERAELKEIIEKSTVDGEVCIVEWGMDCDCVKYHYERNQPAPTVMEYVQREREMYEWADGPCHMAIGKPEKEPENWTRDLVMEAYEDGHPHHVYG